MEARKAVGAGRGVGGGCEGRGAKWARRAEEVPVVLGSRQRLHLRRLSGEPPLSPV